MEFFLTVIENMRGDPEYVMSFPWLALAAVGSSLMGAYGSYKAGREQEKSADRAASQTRFNANAIRAQGQMAATEVRRQTNRTMNDAAAIQAASGFSSSDPTDLRQLAEISGAGKWNEIATLYEAETRARGEDMAARNIDKSGDAAKRAGTLGAASSLISGASGFASLGSSFKSYLNRPTVAPVDNFYPPRNLSNDYAGPRR